MKSKIIKKIVSVIVLTTLIVNVTGCGSKKASETANVPAEELNKATELRIAGGNVYFPYVIALQKGFLEEELGSSVKVTATTDFGSGPAIMEAMTAGDIDIALLGDMPVIQVKANNVDVKIISSLFTSTNGYQLIAAKDSGIKSISNIKGKKVAVMSGSTNHKLLLKYLEKEHLSEEDLEIVFLKNAEQLAAFVGHNVDAAVTQVPTSTNIIKETGAYEVVNAEGYDTILTVITGNNEYLRKNPEIVQKFLKALIKANDWTKDHLDEAVQIISEYADQDYDAAKLYYETRVFEFSLRQELKDGLADTINYLYNQGTISNKFNVNDLVDDSYLKALGID